MGSATSTAAPERARWPRLVACPHPRLRSLLPRGYAGYTEATVPRHLVLPATPTVPLVVKILDSPHRPPAFVMGAHDSSLVVEGDCAPSYMEVRLTPLGAYTLLGLPMGELSGQLVDLMDVLGAAGRRLGERLRETPGWPRRFALLDRFLLERLERGPQPAPEVGWAWERLVASGGGVPIGRLAAEVGWSHRHLIARFREQVGLRPKTAARLVRFDRVWRMKESTATYEVVHVLFVRPDVAAVKVRQRPVTLDGQPIQGQPEGSPLFVMAREGGQWRLVACQNTQVLDA
jgi:hypothetical protein